MCAQVVGLDEGGTGRRTGLGLDGAGEAAVPRVHRLRHLVDYEKAGRCK